MDLPKGRTRLASIEFEDILNAVHSFHDATLGMACFDFHGPMAFIDTMWFGPDLQYNPIPIIGGVFWFDLNTLENVHQLGSYYDRELAHIVVSRASHAIEIQFQDDPFETIKFNYGPNANFQFVTSSSLSAIPLTRR